MSNIISSKKENLLQDFLIDLVDSRKIGYTPPTVYELDDDDQDDLIEKIIEDSRTDDFSILLSINKNSKFFDILKKFLSTKSEYHALSIAYYLREHILTQYEDYINEKMSDICEKIESEDRWESKGERKQLDFNHGDLVWR